MSQPKSQWQRQRHARQVERRERKQRAMKKNYRPRTRTNAQRRSTPARNVIQGPVGPLDWFWQGIQPVGTRLRQKKI